jgi:hypothetical protein
MVGVGLPMAMFTGLLYALAANAVSYFAHRARTTGEELTKAKQAALDGTAFCVYVVGGLIATAAYAMGDPVPLLQGALVATNLLLNMIFQIALGIERYDKAMRVGTILCFVVVMFQLADVGPDPRPKDADVMKMLSQTTAIIWFSALGGLLVLSLIAVRATENQSTESIAKVFTWALHIGVLGSGTDNVASTFGVLSGWVLYLVFASYGLLSVYILGMSAKAPAVCDASTYVPLQLCLQLILNCITGIVVWGDLDRMNGKPLEPYFATIVVVVLGVYVASPSADVVKGVVRWRMMHTTNLSHQVASSAFGKAILVLVECWRNVLSTPGEDSEVSAKQALKQVLSIGVTRNRITPQEVVELAVELYGTVGSFALSATYLKWLDANPTWREYLKLDPEFRKQLLDLLPESERSKLPTSFITVGENMELGTPLANG